MRFAYALLFTSGRKLEIKIALNHVCLRALCYPPRALTGMREGYMVVTISTHCSPGNLRRVRLEICDAFALKLAAPRRAPTRFVFFSVLRGVGLGAHQVSDA